MQRRRLAVGITAAVRIPLQTAIPVGIVRRRVPTRTMVDTAAGKVVSHIRCGVAPREGAALEHREVICSFLAVTSRKTSAADKELGVWLCLGGFVAVDADGGRFARAP
jgi:hypothetical protein